MNNHVMLVGHVGAQPETRVFEKTNTKLSSFSVAVKKIAGKEKQTVWFKVKAWGDLADRVEKYITRGREVVIHGQLDMEIFNSDKGRQEKPVIRLTTFHLCGRKPETSDQAEDASIDTEIDEHEAA